MADDRGQRHVIRVVAAADLVVERIDGSGVHPHPHLARTDFWHRHLAPLDRVRPAEAGEDGGLHGFGHDDFLFAKATKGPMAHCPVWTMSILLFAVYLGSGGDL